MIYDRFFRTSDIALAERLRLCYIDLDIMLTNATAQRQESPGVLSQNSVWCNMPRDSCPRDVVCKTARLLSVMSGTSHIGLDLKEIASKGELPKATAHRILASLGQERLVERVPGTRRYRRTELIFPELLARVQNVTQSRWWREFILSLPVKSGDAVFLIAQHDDRAICVDACFGIWPIDSLTKGIGGTVGLGVGQASSILLAHSPEGMIETVTRRFTERVRAKVFQNIQMARQYGYVAEGDGWIPGVGGIAARLPLTTEADIRLAVGMALSISEHETSDFKYLGDRLISRLQEVRHHYEVGAPHSS